ncbi:MAG: histidine kinase dimerization/phospho-acceptor domain-containing protein, partial [Solirubrobacteraceae bacterium]
MRDARRARRRPWPLRRRLTLAVTSVTALILAAMGVLVYGQFRQGLDERTDAELAERADALSSLATSVPAGRLLAVAGEQLAQVYRPAGEVVDTTGELRGSRLLDADGARAAAKAPLVETIGRVPRGDDGARVRAIPIAGGAVAIAEPRDRREQELQRLATLLGLALPGALLLSALVGYQVAGAALRPVERIRSRAARIGATDLGERLPEPGTRDELDRLTRTLNDLLDRLAGAVERERRVVSDASHELRTPIAVLRARIDVALRGGPDPRRHHAALNAARTDVRRLARLADDLLVLARADQGRLPLRLEPLDVQEILERAAARHATETERARRTLTTAVDISGGAVVLANPARLDQAPDNPVVNTLRYGNDTISLREQEGKGK